MAPKQKELFSCRAEDTSNDPSQATSTGCSGTERSGRSTRDLNSSDGICYTLGIDPGASTSGFAIHSAETSGIVVWGHLDHTNETRKGGVTDRVEIRRRLRRARRSRKWHRPKRFDNRGKTENCNGRWLHPNIKSSLAAHLKLIRFLRKRHDVDRVIIEVSAFDIHAIKKGRELTPEEYQQGVKYGHKNLQFYVWERDKYECQYCGKELNGRTRTIDHIMPVSKRPDLENDPQNVVACCETCNAEKGSKTADEYGQPNVHDKVRGRNKRYFDAMSKMNYFRHVLFEYLCDGRLYVEDEEDRKHNYEFSPIVQKTHGHITAKERGEIGWPKTHRYDASTIATRGRNATLPNRYMDMYWAGRPSRRVHYEEPIKTSALTSSNYPISESNGDIINGQLKRKRVSCESTKSEDANGDIIEWSRGDLVEYRPFSDDSERGFVSKIMDGRRLAIKRKVNGDESSPRVSTRHVKIADSPRLRYMMEKDQ